MGKKTHTMQSLITQSHLQIPSWREEFAGERIRHWNLTIGFMAHLSPISPAMEPAQSLPQKHLLRGAAQLRGREASEDLLCQWRSLGISHQRSRLKRISETVSDSNRSRLFLSSASKGTWCKSLNLPPFRACPGVCVCVLPSVLSPWRKNSPSSKLELVEGDREKCSPHRWQ